MVSIGNLQASKFISLRLIFIYSTALLLYSCTDGSDSQGKGTIPKSDTTNEKPIVKKVRMSFDYPAANIFVAQGEIVPVEVSPLLLEEQPDSAVLFVNGKSVVSAKDFPLVYEWDTKSEKLGKKQVKLTAWFNGTAEDISTSIHVKSDIEPIMYSYKIVKRYSHDTKAYSQGLVFDNGFLFEGTGQYGESTIRKVKLEDGKVQDYFNMPPNIFGEGITIIDNLIYQLSWKEQKGFVYDKNTFELVNRFDFNTEGWGLATDGKKLFMTDGSNKLLVMDKDNFNITETIEVYNNNGPIDNLNELEYINGQIYANVYLSDHIVIIDPKTGKITGQIDLSGLLASTNFSGKVDVLNGIAWDAAKKRLFVTGKLWPYLFEISLVKREL